MKNLTKIQGQCKNVQFPWRNKLGDFSKANTSVISIGNITFLM